MEGEVVSCGRIQPFARRGLNFDFPTDIYPNLISRLRGAPLRAAFSGEGITQLECSRKIDSRWSALENLGHLLDLEELWQLRVSEFLAGQTEITARNMKLQGAPEARYNERDWPGLVSEFASARRLLVERFDLLEPEQFELRSFHPLLRRELRLVDALYFMTEHDDHHLALIWDLLHRGSGIAG